jgi:hypothetical protein
MNRSWITALSLATVAGSGGAFVGVIANTNDTPAAAQSPVSFREVAFVQAESPAPAARTVTYQVGGAGTATLAITSGVLTIDNAQPGKGWGITQTSVPGSHVELQFSDGSQLVTFGADLIGTEVAVAVTNVSASLPVAAAPAEVITVATAPDIAAPTLRPATPAARAAKPAATSPNTASPSGGNDDGAGDDGAGGTTDHEREANDD